jgi:hypothetical protein
MGITSTLSTPANYTDVITGADLGQRNASHTPWRHFGTYQLCAPSASQQCCVVADAGNRYDYWWAARRYRRCL